MRFPYFPFYVSDFISDSKVEAMATIEIGAYVLLLCKAWRENPPGTLPDDDNLLARWAKLSDSVWLEHKSYIMGPFVLKNGKWHQKRMKEEAKKMLARFKERSKSGQKGAKKKWDKTTENKGENLTPENDGSAITLPEQNDSIRSDQIRSDQNIVPPIPPKGDLFGEGSVRVWKPTPDMLRLGALFKRRPSTVWSKNEIKALKAIGKIESHDLELLEAYYRDRIPDANDWRRKDLQTLLNNFNGEVDRARNHKPHKPF